MTDQEILDFVRSGLVKLRYVTRRWQVDNFEGTKRISFTFMCPCGNDIREAYMIPIDFEEHPDDMLKRYHLPYIVRVFAKELESHIVGE